MQIEESKVTRRKIVGWLGVLSLFAMIGGIFRQPKSKGPKTVKMLTQDGQLVEVDVAMLASNKKRISDKELQSWVKSKKQNNSFFKI